MMNKAFKKISFMFLFTLCVVAMSLFTASAEVEGPYTYTIDKGEVTIIRCDETVSLGNLVVPDTLGGIPVTAIADRAFTCCDITSVVLPNSIRSIGEGAFSFCGNLYQVVLPETITEIKAKTFYWCGNLTEVNLSRTKVVKIGVDAFASCQYLSVAALPDTAEEIADRAFFECGELSVFVANKNLKSIGENAFKGCYNLRKIYSLGTEDAWKNVSIASGNEMLSVPEFTYKHTHKYKKSLLNEATCLRDGVNTYLCACGDSYDEFFKGDHTLKSTVTKATAAKDGKIVYKCTLCKKTTKTTKIYKASDIKLSSTTVTYNGKVRTPKVTVKNSAGTTLTEGKHYTIKYESGRKLPGKYYIKVTFTGSRYTGSQTLYLTIKPQNVELTSVTSKNAGKAELKWGKETADGYQIYMASSKDGKYTKIKSVTSASSVSYTVGSLTKGKTYYFKVRAYKKTDNGTVYGTFSNVKSVRIK